jgi:hypothetical protein
LTYKTILPYLVLLCITLFMLGANPFKSQTIAPMDLLVKYPGWKNTHLQVPYINGERSDVLDAKLPIWLSAKRDLYNGEIPVWNHQRAGKPGLTFTNSLFTPAFAVFALIKDDALGFYLSNLVNVLIGIFGMYLFLQLFLNRTASMFGAFIFIFSGFNAAWFFWAHVDTAIWTPWVFFAVYGYLKTQKKAYLPLVTFSMLMLNLGGFPMIAVMTYMAIAIMVVIFFLLQRTAWKQIVTSLMYLALFSLLSVLIALPFILPLVELLSWMGGIGYRHGGPGFKLHELRLFINPELYRVARVEATFYVGILPVISLFVAILLWFKHRKDILLTFGIVLFFYALTIAFALIGPELIHKVPTLNSSLLTRFGYLIDVALAIIAASVLHYFIERFKAKRWLPLTVFVIFSLQIADQYRLFHKFNGPVPNAAFYPVTKSIAYLQTHLKPLQYIMADQGFLINGTLGGYGLNDWYAHTFHAPAEKEILRKIVKHPFRTPTSAMFPFSSIDLKSPYIDLLNIKVILSTSFSPYALQHLWDNERKQMPAPALPTNTLEQSFSIDKEIEAEGIALLMATFGKEHASSDIALTLFKEGKALATATASKEQIKDNSWVGFTFGTPFVFTPGEYRVKLKMLDTTRIHPVTVWLNKGVDTHRAVINGKEEPVSFKLALFNRKDLTPHYRIMNLEPDIYILENMNVKGEAYFIPERNGVQHSDYSHVKTTHPSNTHILIDYTSNRPGWIVVPMRTYPGWHASINGTEVPLSDYLGMLPAIKVDGRSTIDFYYRPSYTFYSYLLSFLSIIVLLFLIWKFNRKKRQ